MEALINSWIYQAVNHVFHRKFIEIEINLLCNLDGKSAKMQNTHNWAILPNTRFLGDYIGDLKVKL